MLKKIIQRSKLIILLVCLFSSTFSIAATSESTPATTTARDTAQWQCQLNEKGRWVCTEPQTATVAQKPDAAVTDTAHKQAPTEDATADASTKTDAQPDANVVKTEAASGDIQPLTEQLSQEATEQVPAVPTATDKAETIKLRKAIVAVPSKRSSDQDRWSCKSDEAGNWLCQSAPPLPVIKGYEPAPESQIIAGTQQAPATSRPIQYGKLDWVKREYLTAEQQANIPAYCPGAYIEPPYADPKLREVDPETQPLLASSDRSETNASGRSTLSGDVIIKQGYRQVKSDKAVIDREANTVDFGGHTEFREPDFLLTGDHAKMNMATDEVTIDNAEFVAHSTHMRGAAQQLWRDESGVFHVTEGSFTHCQPGSNIWLLSGSKVELNQTTGIGTAKHAVLRIKDVPVFYMPYMQFPIDDRRMSGVLFPQFGTSDDGVDLSVPYYFNIAPNYDATLTPHYIADRGLGAELEFRYLHTNNSGILGGAYLPDDDAYNKEDRWLGTIKHDGVVLDHVTTQLDFSTVSDNDYFSDLGTDLSITSKTHLLRLAEAGYHQDYWNLTTRVQGYQTIDASIADVNKPYDRLPQILLDGHYPFDNGIKVGISSEYAHFDRDNSNLTGLDQAVGQRVHLEPRISWLIESSYAYIKPEVKYKLSQYSLDDLDSSFDDSPSISTPVYSLDTGLFFERMASLGGESMTQTFEPRLFYLNVPEDEGQELIPNFDTSELTFSYDQLFRDNRFVGHDRVGDANQLSVGLTTRFIDDSGFERFRFSGGQIFYFEDRNVTLTGTPADSDLTSESAYAAEFLYALKSGWQLDGDIIWDPETSQTNESSINLSYHGDAKHIFNIGYRVRQDRDQIEQTDVSLIWPVSNQWAMFTRWNHDLIQKRIIEALAGVEYQNCCLRIRVAARRWINSTDITATDGVSEKDAIYIQLQLKGLAGIGESLEGILSNSITGYEEQN